eukprot:TRINITY_DN53123_c0_g1_i1.p2 TRINITY_DN53123_c0_g1~~TRINITY_DN53123_c0_g1_i1.p2  ORF type:complete len:228 (+),score=84.24 TRINITY_DN53123_c0_g1_i1:151-834(+)
MSSDHALVQMLCDTTELTQGAARVLLEKCSGDAESALEAFFGGEVDRDTLEQEAGKKQSGQAPACQFFWNGHCRKGSACTLRHTDLSAANQPPSDSESSTAGRLFTRRTEDMTYEELLELGDAMGKVRLSVPPEVRRTLPVFRSATPNQLAGVLSDSCAICMEGFCCGESITLLHCRHPFHTDCIGQWMDGNKSCPMCKGEILAKPPAIPSKPSWMGNMRTLWGKAQ